MAKEAPSPSTPEEPPSGTVRVSGDVLEWLRYIVFHERDPRGRRFRLAELVDALLREPTRKRYEALRARVEGREKGGKS